MLKNQYKFNACSTDRVLPRARQINLRRVSKQKTVKQVKGILSSAREHPIC